MPKPRLNPETQEEEALQDLQCPLHGGKVEQDIREAWRSAGKKGMDPPPPQNSLDRKVTGTREALCLRDKESPGRKWVHTMTFPPGVQMYQATHGPRTANIIGILELCMSRLHQERKTSSQRTEQGLDPHGFEY